MLSRRTLLIGAGGSALGCTCGWLKARAQGGALQELGVCTELTMSDVQLASAIAWNENPKNKVVASSDINAEALSLMEKRWHPQRRILNVHFIDPPSFASKIMTIAAEWHSYMNMRFVFDRGTPDILVSFSPGGSWSYIGTDSQYYARKGLPSMNFSWVVEPHGAELRRTTLHEFGHALSLVHEHKHPEGGIKWKRDAVYAYYKQRGWDEDKVNRNIFVKYDLPQVNGSAYDSTSIMHYPIPSELLNDAGQVVGWNDTLSANDQKVIETLYKQSLSLLPE